MTTASPTIAPGTVIDGIYTVHESLRTRLGAETFAATDPDGGSVEVTAYRPESFANRESEEQALQELRALSSVTDPRIVRVLGSGRLDDGGIYEVHERIEGEFVSTAGESPDALADLETILGALHQAIEVGVVHHNLGPDVVVRTADGLKVGWFAVGEPQGGVSFGAIECIAPEQVEGKGVTESTLVYNLAALGQRLRSGEPLFSGDVATLLLQHAASTPPPSVHPAFSKALAKDPKARPSLADFAASLATIDAPEENVPIPRAPSGLPGFGRLGPSTGSKLPPPPGGSLAPPPTLGGLGAAKSRPIFGAPGEKSAPIAAASPPPASASPMAPPVASPRSASAPSVDAPSVNAPSATPPVSAPPLGAPKLGAPSLGGGSANPAKKPRTRGWTMFMEATEDEPAPATVPVAAPPVAAPPVGVPAITAPPVGAPALSSAPTVGAPVAAPPLGAPPVAPPFAATTGTAAPALGAPTAPALGAPTAPALGAPTAPPLGGGAASAPSAAPPAAAAPSTRGWTMIMDDPEEAEAATPAVPAAAPVPAAPSTRGWTMLEELNESPEVSSELGSDLDPDPAAAGAPTSRGWTMFMEAELEGEAAEAAPEPEPDPGFYEGPMTTDAGTVVAAAPLAPSPAVRMPASPSAPAAPVAPRPGPGVPEPEPMTSFAAKLRGPESDPEPEPEPTPLETTAESLAALAEEATASTQPEAPATVSPVMPSFSGGGSSFDLKPTTAPSPTPTPTEYEDEDEPKQGRVGSAVAIVVMLALVAFLVYYFFFS